MYNGCSNTTENMTSDKMSIITDLLSTMYIIQLMIFVVLNIVQCRECRKVSIETLMFLKYQHFTVKSVPYF